MAQVKTLRREDSRAAAERGRGEVREKMIRVIDGMAVSSTVILV